ncbi:asparagine synthase-related protein, partial [Candidatus Altiarchaeota archaeon]
MNVDEKFDCLKKLIEEQRSVLVAFSGGVDSSLLAYVAHEVLGNNALAVTVDSKTIPGAEVESARETAKWIGVKHRVVEYDELWDENFAKNPRDRCYFCKKNLLAFLEKMKLNEGLDTVIEGTDSSELEGHRPGFQAVGESDALAPLVEVGLGK